MTGLPKPETMLAYASILEKQQYIIKNNVRYPIPTGEIVEAACAALRYCASLVAQPQYLNNCLRAGACHGICESTACTNYGKDIVVRRCVETKVET